MAFQTRDLWMLSLGLEGDSPPNKLQPPVGDGMHLRWAFDPAKGFPAYGYYLFRRPAAKGDPICLSWSWPKTPGTPGPDRMPMFLGELSSDEPLSFIDEFPSAGVAEVDLDHRRFVRYQTPEGEPVRWAKATIALRKRETDKNGKRECVDFRRAKEGAVDNPLSQQAARFLAFDKIGQPRPVGRMQGLGGIVGWRTGHRAEVSLPCTATQVDIVIASFSRLSPPRIVALDKSRQVVNQVVANGGGIESLRLTGNEIVAIHIETPDDETTLLRLCWECVDGKDDQDKRSTGIRVTARWKGVAVAAGEADSPGTITSVELAADAIDEVVISGGDAALIDLCVVPVKQGLASGWETLKGFVYPLCLPVNQIDYPCPRKPATNAAAETMGVGRISYGSRPPWRGARFTSLHDRMKALVVGGLPPVGPPMNSRFERVTGTPAPPGLGDSVTQQRQRPLDLLLMGSLHPAIAQILGLYWYDKTAILGTAYDYLLLADHDGSLGGDAERALLWIRTVLDFSVVDGVVISGKTVLPATPLTPPTDVRGYALPGSTVTPSDGGRVLDATNSAGLTWNRRQADDVIQADSPVMFQVWSAALGNQDLPTSPKPEDFEVLTRTAPIPVTRTILSPPQSPPNPEDWPPFALHYIDRGRADGWYGYRVSGIDIFGRHSPQSGSAAWWQWAPVPNPRPWYYTDPRANRLIHSSAVRLLDKIPPPPPVGVEAFALDPKDPSVLRDAAWQSWHDSLSETEKKSVIGLRVRWQWTLTEQQQAPDTREFRVYYEPAPLNTLRGRVTSVADVTATETDVRTDIPNAQPANSFAGLSIRIGAESFVVISSRATSPLRLRVRNIGPTDEIRPAARTRCALTLLPAHPLFDDFSIAAEWQDRLLFVPYRENVTVDAAGSRRYQVFMPVPKSLNRAGLPLTTTLEEPISAAVIGVTACDDKQHTPDQLGDLERYGNESRIGGPATVFIVHREPPPAPGVPANSAKLYASPADYHGRSHFTYRWLPAARLKMFPYRALDDAVFKADLAQRPRPVPLLESDLQYFPNEAIEPSWNAAKRAQIAAELNTLDALDKTNKAAVSAAYRALSNDALRVLAGLPATEKVFVQLTPKALDPDEPEAGAPGGLRWQRIGLDVAPGSLAAGQRAYVDTLDGRATNRYFYRAAYVDEVQNVGPLSLSSPPVFLPDVTPPVAPKITRVTPDDCKVTLEWSSNRDPDLAEYRIYRTLDSDRSRDIRQMDLVQTELVAEGDPSARPAKLSWTDNPVPGLRDIWYRIVAVDRVDPDPKGGGGNVSAPSPAIRTRAFDTTPPVPPVITTVEWVRVDPLGNVHAWDEPVPADVAWLVSARLAWAATDEMKLMVQVKSASDANFSAASAWLAPGTSSYLHGNTRTFEGHTYRLKAISGSGNLNVVYNEVILAAVDLIEA